MSSTPDFLHWRAGAVHPEVSLDDLVAHFAPIHDERELHESAYRVTNITSAWHLFLWEKYRRDGGLISPAAIPTDVFLWAIGEAPDPAMTRIGGIPYLPAGTKWPIIGDEPATFLAQINFRDSRDLLSFEPPGDILLIFVRGERWLFESRGYAFLWVDQGDATIIDDTPRTPSWPFFQGWAARARTYDDPTMWEAAYGLPNHEKLCLWQLPVTMATKIGGAPWDAQTNHPQTPAACKMLCQLSSVQAAYRLPFPWLNRRLPIGEPFGSDGLHTDDHELMIGDMGGIYFFMHEDGRIRFDGSCA